MPDPHGTDSRRSDLPRRLDLESPSSGGSIWPWLAALVAIVAILGVAIGYAHILAILLDQVEGIEDGFMRGRSQIPDVKLSIHPARATARRLPP